MVSLHVGGGGIRGAFVAQCLHNVFTKNSSVENSIELASGLSAGSIVASCVATNTPLPDAISYLNTKQFVDENNICQSAFRVYRLWNDQETSFYDNNRLNDVIANLFDHKVCRFQLSISMAEADTFNPVSHTVQKNSVLDPTLVTASCSIPGLFSPVRYCSNYYIDAGTVQELNHESISCALHNAKIKLHILCSCHPWVRSTGNVAYHSEFKPMAKHLAHMLWQNGVVAAHNNDLKDILGIKSFPSGRSLLCMRRNKSSFSCAQIVTPETAHSVGKSKYDFFVLLVAPTEKDYAGFEDATLLDSPRVRGPVIKNMLTKAESASTEILKLISFTNLECLQIPLSF